MALKEIRVLHLDGEWEDVRIAKETKSTPFKGVAFPRELLSSVCKEGKKGKSSVLPNLEVPGVYLLIGCSEGKGSKAFVYIGQSIKGVGGRLTQHDAKDTYPWWTDTIAFIKESEALHDGLISHVESSLIGSVGVNPQWGKQQNNPSENAGNLSPEDRLLWRDLVPDVKKIIGALGWNIFSNFAEGVSLTKQVTVPRTKGYPEFECKGNGYRAKMYIVDSGQFVVEEGSTVRKETAKTTRRSILKERDVLIEKRILHETESGLEFTKNHSFSSAWKAASVISGRPIDGDNAWRSPDGKLTYGMWKNKKSTRNKAEDRTAIESVETVTVEEKGKWVSPEFYYSGIDFDGTMQIDNSGDFVVKAGSKASEQASPSTSKGIRKVREDLRSEGVLDEIFRFTKNHGFSAVSTSASAVRGQMKNGNVVWKLSDGRTYEEWKIRQKNKT